MLRKMPFYMDFKHSFYSMIPVRGWRHGDNIPHGAVVRLFGWGMGGYLFKPGFLHQKKLLTVAYQYFIFQFEMRQNLSKFDGKASISSAELFGNGPAASSRGPYGNSAGGGAGPDLSEIKEGVRQGVTKVAGKLSSLANGVMSSIQVGPEHCKSMVFDGFLCGTALTCFLLKIRLSLV